MISSATASPAEDVHSYYQDSVKYTLETGPLTTDEVADVVVIGAGFTGVNTALELAERGSDVVLLDAQAVGFGGSGRNGGQMICGIGHDPELVRKQLSDRDFGQLYTMGLEAVQILTQRIETYQIDCDFRWGYCTVAYDQKRLAMLQQAQAFLNEQGYPFATKLLQGDELAGVVASDRYVGGLLDQGSGHLHPLNLVLGEAKAAQDQGVRIYSHSPALRIEKGERVEVHTPQGKVTARTLVYACNAYLQGLDSYLEDRYVTTNAFSIATEPLSDALIQRLMPGGAAICDNRPVIDYYRVSADNRLLFGGATHFVEYLPGDLDAHLRKNLSKVFPELANVRFDYRWSGRMAIGANLFPQVNRLPGHDNIYFAQAYAGFGVGPSHLVARALADAICGQPGHFEVLSKIQHPRIVASRPLNRLWVTAGKCWHQLEALFH